MTTLDFITELFYRIDEAMKDVPKHPQAALYASEVVTLAFMFAIKGVGNRPFSRWLERDWRACFPQLPDRTRVFRLFRVHLMQYAWIVRPIVVVIKGHERPMRLRQGSSANREL